jgi:hypothetical protein
MYEIKLDMMNKANEDLQRKIDHFQQLCDLGNYEIPINEMNIDAVIQRLAVVVKY